MPALALIFGLCGFVWATVCPNSAAQGLTPETLVSLRAVTAIETSRGRGTRCICVARAATGLERGAWTAMGGAACGEP